MAGILSISKEGELQINREALKLCSFLQNVNDRELKYIAMAYDYINSPWYMKPFEERQLIARRKYYKEMEEPEKEDHIKAAIEEYESLIFDETLYVRDQYKSKLQRMMRKQVDEDDPIKIKNNDAAIAIIMKRIDELTIQAKRDQEALELKGGKKLSLLEQFKRSKKLHELYKKSAADVQYSH